MAIIRRASATWTGAVETGTGSMRLGRQGQELPFSLRSRVADGTGTNPEELLGAAHAGCFSMSLASLLEENGTPGRVVTDAKVTLDESGGSFTISAVELTTSAHDTSVDLDVFVALATKAKETCPVSRLFASVEITLKASLG
jgi:lipoyl-dependent peroxiredoxin